MDSIESLRFFIRCVEKQGIAMAGRDFGMSAATASSRLSELEIFYAAKLLNRTTRSISLTDEGRILFEQARHLVNEADSLRNRIKLGTTQVSGTIKLSAPHDMGRNLISPILDEFMGQHPDIDIELVLADGYLDLVEKGINLAVRLGKAQDSTLVSRRLASNRRVICAAPHYWEKHGLPEHPRDLSEHNCLIMHWGKIINQEWSFKQNDREINVTVSGNRASNCGDQVKNWCLSGHGIAFKSIWDIEDHLVSGALVEGLHPFTQDQDNSVQLLFPGGYAPSGRVRSLIDFMVGQFKVEESAVAS